MNKAEAISVLKEIIAACGRAIPYVAIMPPKSDKALSDGYKIHVKTRPDTFDKACIRSISKRKALALKEIEELLVVYKPKKK